MAVGPSYCRYCEEQAANCLVAAREQEGQRAYFLTLAWRWVRLARDLENRDACGTGCPLHETCRAAQPATVEPDLAAMNAGMERIPPAAASEFDSIPTA